MPRAQDRLSKEPYDRWLAPDGSVQAEFHRISSGFLVRFPDIVDFEIAYEAGRVCAYPVSDVQSQQVQSLYENAVLPLLGNHSGGLFLHGSAVQIGSQTAAFVGASRSGKTTLAGAFAKAGYPYLTEDVIELTRSAEGYRIEPKSGALRLFADSAAHLLGRRDDAAARIKTPIASSETLPASHSALPVWHIFILGEDIDAPFNIHSIPPQEALTTLLAHAFILDVEDKERLASHFDRMATLCENIACSRLDFTREYTALPEVIAGVVAAVNGRVNSSEEAHLE